jgi:LPPG:FO 2-phospho-L-lactate transferase
MKVALLAGGTGGTKLAHGFAQLAPKLTLSVIANVGDDVEMHGHLVCPDIDALLYTLSGLIDTDQGWGVRGDTHTAHAMFERLGAGTWFRIGDADLAAHAHRTRLMREEGASLTDAIAAMAAALGIESRILPATDDRWRTLLDTDEGTMEFQEYFVHRRQEPEVRAVRFDGDPRPTNAALEAIADADLVVMGPSNPIVSIGPILALPGMREAVAEAAATVAVSPIVAGRALKGPADRMLTSLGHDSSAVGVARIYNGLVHRFVVDEADAHLAPTIEAEMDMAVRVLPTVMRSDEDRRALAAALVEGAA